MIDLSAKEYFDMVKENKKKITDEDLLKAYENAEILLQKAMITNQVNASIESIKNLFPFKHIFNTLY